MTTYSKEWREKNERIYEVIIAKITILALKRSDHYRFFFESIKV